MATYKDLSLRDRFFMMRYRFSRYALNPVPCTSLRKSIRQSRAALVTTAALHLPDQPPFDASIRTGDSSFREIPTTVETVLLLEAHKSDSFDHAGIQADRNLAFPLDRFRELEARGEIGSLNRRHFSFMGSITGPRTLIDESAPRAARLLASDGVNIAFLTPV